MEALITNLAGKIVLITGSTDGVGRLAARRLGEAGAEVLVHGRDGARGEEVVSEIKAAGGNCAMYARLLATLCLLPMSGFFALADSAVPTGIVLEVYLKGGEASTPDVLAAMNRELGILMQGAGFRVIWRDANDPPSAAGAERLVIVELRGVCMAQFTTGAAMPLSSTVPLASSSVVDGKILPFSWVDCAALNRFLAPVAADRLKSEQDELYGRSMARLLAHELYHVLAQTDSHAPSGIAKARFSTADLMADHFDFETVSWGGLRPPLAVRRSSVQTAPEGATVVSGDDISVGR